MEQVLVLKNQEELNKVVQILLENGINVLNKQETVAFLAGKREEIRREHNAYEILKWQMEYLMMGGEDVLDELPTSVKIEIGAYIQDGEECYFFDGIKFETNNKMMKEIENYLEENIDNLFEGLHIPQSGGIFTYSVDPKNKIKQVF